MNITALFISFLTFRLSKHFDTSKCGAISIRYICTFVANRWTIKTHCWLIFCKLGWFQHLCASVVPLPVPLPWERMWTVWDDVLSYSWCVCQMWGVPSCVIMMMMPSNTYANFLKTYSYYTVPLRRSAYTVTVSVLHLNLTYVPHPLC